MFDAGEIATFTVYKDFDDNNPAGVEVSIRCNDGLPLESSKVITEDGGVTFVVTNFTRALLRGRLNRAR